MKPIKHSDGDKPIDAYEIIALAKRLNISTDEMKDMSFVSLMNILISSVENNEEDNVRKATQEDIDRMFKWYT